MLDDLPELPEPLGTTLRALADKLCDETISEEEALQLNALLRDEPEAQAYYLAYLGVHARLGWEFGSSGPPILPANAAASEHAASPVRPLPTDLDQDEPTATPWFATWRWPLVGGGLTILLLLGGAIFFGMARWRERLPVAAAPARVSAGVALEWEDPLKAMPIGQPLPVGRHRLAMGIAEITFAGGAMAVVEGPADFEILGPDRAVVHAGQVVVRAEDIARGFVLDTAKTEIVDLGTEFGVKVNRSSETEVHVFEGSVIARLKGGEGRVEQRLEAGQALHYAAGSSAQPQAAPSAPQRFVRRVSADMANPARKIPLNESVVAAVRVLPAPTTVVIDGVLDEWDPRGAFHTACKPPYEHSHYVTGQMMYDRQRLYIAAHVGDLAPMRNVVDPQTDADRAWCGGGLQVRISTDRMRPWPLTGESPWHVRGRRAVRADDVSEHLAHLTLWYHAPTHKACLHVTYGMDLHGDRVNPAGYQGAFRRDADDRGYTLEYAIPWSLLGAADGAPPRRGDILATSWNVHWSNESGRLWQGHLVEVLNPKESGWTFMRAATWGKAIYE